MLLGTFPLLMKISRQKFLFNAGFTVAIIIIVVISFLMERSMKRAREYDAQVKHSNIFIQKLDGFSSAIKDAESSLRGYIITWNKAYLQLFNEAKQNINDRIPELKELISDNPDEQVRFEGIILLGERKFSELDSLLDIMNYEGFEAASDYVSTNYGKKIMDSIRVNISNLQKEEINQLNEKTKMRQLFIDRINGQILIGGIFCILILFVIFLFLQKRTSELEVTGARAERSDRAKSAFLASMSHELRTPLNSIIGFSGILLQEFAGPVNKEQRKQLEMVMASGRHLLRLINDMLDITIIEAGELKIHYETFDIVKVIEEVVALEKSSVEAKGISIHLQKSHEVLEITSDPARIKQILLNLVHNAMKFTERGSIRVECQSVNSHLEIKVSDTGIGVSRENMDKLFTPFLQIDNDLVRKHQGTGSGLGLSISKRLVDLLNGKITVESEYGVGSTFTVYLPLVHHGDTGNNILTT